MLFILQKAIDQSGMWMRPLALLLILQPLLQSILLVATTTTVLPLLITAVTTKPRALLLRLIRASKGVLGSAAPLVYDGKLIGVFFFHFCPSRVDVYSFSIAPAFLGRGLVDLSRVYILTSTSLDSRHVVSVQHLLLSFDPPERSHNGGAGCCSLDER